VRLTELFGRFLRFGFAAHGGPAAQIGMLRRELVDRERWIEPEQFRRVLSVYQALPGPEATELSVHFGMLKKGRRGGLVAGLGFVLPGLVLMLIASALYVSSSNQGGGAREVIAKLSMGAAPAAVVLMGFGAFRIARGNLSGVVLWIAAIGAAVGELSGVPFWISLILAGVLAEAARKKEQLIVKALVLTGLLALAVLLRKAPMIGQTNLEVLRDPSLLWLFGVGLRGGLLTFGGAYTSVPFVRNLVVGQGGFMNDLTFLDGIALGNLLPAPLVIFSTFVGYVGAGLPGAMATTVGMFLPAFAFTLLGFDLITKVIEAPRVHAFLDGVTAGVVGIMAVTVIRFGVVAFDSVAAALAALLAAAVLIRFKSSYAAPLAVLAAVAAALVVEAF
jgi:chromate transporter